MFYLVVFALFPIAPGNENNVQLSEISHTSSSGLEPFLSNVSSFNFQVENLLESKPYKIRIYARNARGKSDQLWIPAQTLRKAEKYTLSNITAVNNTPLTVSSIGDALTSLGQIKSLAIAVTICLTILLFGIIVAIAFMGKFTRFHRVKRSQLKNEDIGLDGEDVLNNDNDHDDCRRGVGGGVTGTGGGGARACLHDLNISSSQNGIGPCITSTTGQEFALHSLGLQTLYTETNDAICSEYYRNLLTHYNTKNSITPDEMQMLSLDLYKINSVPPCPSDSLGNSGPGTVSGPPDLIPTFYYNNDPSTAGTSSSCAGTITLDSDATMTILDTSRM